jgi:hypothetical protein
MNKVASYWELREPLKIGSEHIGNNNKIQPPPPPPMIKNLNTLGACCLTSLAARILFAYLYSLA